MLRFAHIVYVLVVNVKKWSVNDYPVLNVGIKTVMLSLSMLNVIVVMFESKPSQKHSSVSFIYKNKHTVFFLSDSIKSTTIVSKPNHSQLNKSKNEDNEKFATVVTSTTKKITKQEVLNPMGSPMVSNIFNLFNYLKMEPNQQMNFLSTFAWILQTTQMNKAVEENIEENETNK